MDDLDKTLVASILRDGKPALKRARDRGLRPDLLKGDGKGIYEFLVEYHLRFDALPPIEVIQGKTGIELPSDLPLNLHTEFLVDEIFNRRTYEHVYKGYKKIEEQLVATPPNVKTMVQTLEEVLLELRREQLTNSKVESLFSLGPMVKEHYEKIKNGARGIQTPWPLINEATFGFWPMDLVLFVARVGIGKTWSAVILALHAWKQGKRVLFASTEISRMRIGMRLYSLMCKLPYQEFTKGQLTRIKHPDDPTLDEGSEVRFYKAVEEFLEREGLYVVGGNFDFRVESLSAAIDEVRPDFVILDGAYLLRTTGASRTEKAANAFDELKRLAIRHEIAMAVTHQFNREVKANVATSVRTESIGLTDVAGWNADLIFGLIQTDDMKRDRKMRIKPLKVREGFGDEIELHWDFGQMMFDEIGRVSPGGAKGGGGDAEEFDNGSGTTDAASGPDEVPF